MIFPGAGREASAYPGASPGRAEGPIAFSPLAEGRDISLSERDIPEQSRSGI